MSSFPKVVFKEVLSVTRRVFHQCSFPLFSGVCYKEVTRPLLTAAPHRRKPHCIQLVEIPPTPDSGQRGAVHLAADHSPTSHRHSITTVDRLGQPLITISQ